MSKATILWPSKSPAEVIDYGLNWKKGLKPGEYIVSSVWVSPTGITVGESGLDEDYPTTTVIWLSGGVNKTTYRFINRIGTSEGRLLEAAASLEVRAT